MDKGTKHGKVIPTTFGLKYNPPKLGIQYYFQDNPKATFVHEVNLENVANKKTEEVINDLFTKHKKFIDPKVVSRNQLENLMERLKSNASKQGTTKDMPISNGSTNKQVEGEKENINKYKSGNKEVVPKAVSSDPWDLEENDKPNSDLMNSHPLDKVTFGGCKKEEQKQHDKNFMLDDFDFDNKNQKISDVDDMFDGLEDDLVGKNSKNINSNRDNSKDLHSLGNEDGDEEESDAIDIDNEDELAARGLKKIQIEGEEEEYLMDAEGNIYNLNGDFIGTTNGNEEEGGDGDGDEDEDDF